MQCLVTLYAGISVGIVILLVLSSWLYLGMRKRSSIIKKEKFFKENGGVLLQQKLITREGSRKSSTNTMRIFSDEELKKATNSYEECRIIGQGGFGTVYKGYLSDGIVVAIKKSKIIDRSQIDQFINEMLVLSQINHRNVVKLLGCCLETEVPLLVYEFISNGTLFDHIHDKTKASSLTWDIRLRIATETAGVLAYLHSIAYPPIIHRDVKSVNVLLDDNYVAKVSDFGASRVVPLDEAELSTMVQGTLGYLDPEYLQTSQLTEKSDVYSFGVVFAELLTRKKALSFDRLESERSLTSHFTCCLKENRLFDILDDNIVSEKNMMQLQEVAKVVKKCISIKGDDRPTMKEVAMELEGLRLSSSSSRLKSDDNCEEMYSLLDEQPITYAHKDTTAYYDSINDHFSIPIGGGR